MTLEDLKTRSGAIKAIEEVVKGQEDFVYEAPGDSAQCRYLYNDKPSCLIGHVLRNHGVARDYLRTADKSVFSAELVSRELGLPEEVAVVFQAAQHEQDNGVPWSKALWRARRAKIDRG